jgi:hypothetical protein
MAASRSSAPPAIPPVAGVTRNADVNENRSSRIGSGGGWMIPLASAKVNVIPSYGASGAFVNCAVAPLLVTVSHGKSAPYWPVAQKTRWMSAGACTTADPRRMGTDHSVPIAFHTSSSWSANLFIAPSTRYTMSYVWTPVISRSGSPILMRSSSPSSSTEYSVGVPGDPLTERTVNGYTRSYPRFGDAEVRTGMSR